MSDETAESPCTVEDQGCTQHGDTTKNGHTLYGESVCDWYAWMFGCDSHTLTKGTYV